MSLAAVTPAIRPDLYRAVMRHYPTGVAAICASGPATGRPCGLIVGTFQALSLDPALVTQATFRAIGPFVEPNTLLINRLAAMPGVLSYKEGRVVDMKTGTVLD